MSKFVQFSEAPTLNRAASQYRDGFRKFAEGSCSDEDEVYLFEGNQVRREQLQSLWTGFRHVQIEDLHWQLCQSETREIVVYSVNDKVAPLGITSPNEKYVQRFSPGSDLVKSASQIDNILSVLSALSESGAISHVSIDLRLQREIQIPMDYWKFSPFEAITITTEGIESAVIRLWRKSLRTAGFVPAGRAYGAAGTGSTFINPSNLSSRFNAHLAELKVRLGVLVVWMKSLIPSVETRRALKERATRLLFWKYSHCDVLDPTFGKPFSQLLLNELEEAVSAIEAAPNIPREFDVENGEHIRVTALKCFETHGIWPISFSYPRVNTIAIAHHQSRLSSITPGFPYSFDDESQYLETYGNSLLGITHRKAGWDCFRHLEIFASGAIPYMIDARGIPKYSMVHYPRHALIKVTELVKSGAGVPSESLKDQLRTYFANFLTSSAMAQYILDIVGSIGSPRILFVDEKLPAEADYLSVLTLIGLKQILGSRCEVLFPVDYVYQDTGTDVRNLYGRGFGYTRVLDVSSKSNLELNSDLRDAIQLDTYDFVVVGSIARNKHRAKHLLKMVDPMKTIWIHGEDTPPTLQEAHELRTSGAHVFVRSIH